MKLADLPVRLVSKGINVKMATPRCPPPTDELMEDVRKIVAFKNCLSPSQLEDRYRFNVNKAIESLRLPGRCPHISAELRAEILAHHKAWMDARENCLTYKQAAERHGVSQDRIAFLVHKMRRGQ